MAQAGFTPISLYYSTTPGGVPVAGNLVSGELALNIADGLLFYKDSGGVVRSFNATLSPTATNLSGGSTGSLPYQSGPSTTTFLAPGANGQVLTLSGGVPTWTSPAAVSVTTFAGGSTGLTPAAATSGAVTLAGTLVAANGGTGLATIPANAVMVGNGTSAVQTVAPGASGQVLTSNGTAWVSQAPAGGSIPASYNSVGATVAVSFINNGGVNFAPGAILPGSVLEVTDNDGSNVTTLPGSWRSQVGSLFIRVA